jgi:hypothetical protein
LFLCAAQQERTRRRHGTATWRLRFGQQQHGVAAVPGPAAAFVVELVLLGGAAVQAQAVVVVQFFARLDVALGVDVDVRLAARVVHLLGLAVGRAAVVDPARRVAAHAGVDHVQAVIEREEEGVEGIVRVRGVTIIGFVVGDQLTLVFDDARALGDVRGGKHAIAMDGALADDIQARGRGHGSDTPLKARRAMLRGQGTRTKRGLLQKRGHEQPACCSAGSAHRLRAYCTAH